MREQVDTDHSGGISFDEFVAMMQLKEVETDFEKEINEAFKFFDKDGDGEVIIWYSHRHHFLGKYHLSLP